MGEVAVTVHKTCDLTDPALLDQLGLDVDGLCTDDWKIPRILGNLIRDSGFEGMVVPSAAGPYKNLVLFLDRFASRSSLDLIDIRPLRINGD